MDKFCLNQKYYKGSKSVSGDLKNQYGHDQAFLSKTTTKQKIRYTSDYFIFI